MGAAILAILFVLTFGAIAKQILLTPPQKNKSKRRKSKLRSNPITKHTKHR